MPTNHKTRKRPGRLTIPARLSPLLPKIHWALITLRQTIEFEWTTTATNEKRITPFMSVFDDATQAEIERLKVAMKAPRQSRSAIVATALELYSQVPKAGEPDRGLAAPNGIFSKEGEDNGYA